MMDRNERIALLCVRVLGVLVLLVLVLFFSGACPRLFHGRGDLFRLSSIEKFKESVAYPFHSDESVQTAPLDSAVVWWIGDSFSRVQFGHRPLPEEVDSLLGKFTLQESPLASEGEMRGRLRVSFVDYIDLQGSPKMLLALAAAREKAGLSVPKVIVIECVERNVYANLGEKSVFDYGDVPPWDEGRGLGSKIKRIRRRAFMEAPLAVDFKMRRFPPVATVRKWSDTWRYSLYGDMHPGAIADVEHVKDSVVNRLAFAQDAAGVLLDWKNEVEYEAIARNLKNLDSFAQSFGARILFVMPPNRELVWAGGVDEMSLEHTRPNPQGKTHYFDFYDMLDSAGVPSVDLTIPFLDLRRAGVELYWRTDSHWNANAHAVAAREISLKIRELLGEI